MDRETVYDEWDVENFRFELEPKTVTLFGEAEFIMPDGTMVIGDRSTWHRHENIAHNVGFDFYGEHVDRAREEFANELIEKIDSGELDEEDIHEDLENYEFEDYPDFNAKVSEYVITDFLNQSGAIRNASVQAQPASYYYSPPPCEVSIQTGDHGVTAKQAAIVAKEIRNQFKEECMPVELFIDTPWGVAKEKLERSIPPSRIEAMVNGESCACLTGFEPCCK